MVIPARPVSQPYQFESKVKSTISPWCNSGWKRAGDFFWAVLLLLIFSPLMLFIALAVRFTSAGPVFFRQRRPGRNGREFSILKFRTMIADAQHAGPVLTRAYDPRITWFGRYMRKWKLDELPQLFNVIRGEMSFVGPRPQPTKLWKEPSIAKDAAVVLSVRPGITSETTLVFRHEEEVLAPLSPHEVEEVYLRTLMPLKLKMEVQYLGRATFLSDLQILLRTFGRLFHRHEEQNDLLKEHLPGTKDYEVKPAALPSTNASSVSVFSAVDDLAPIAARNASGQETLASRMPGASAE